MADDSGLNGLKVKYCNVQNFYQQETVVVNEGLRGDWGTFVMCDYN